MQLMTEYNPEDDSFDMTDGKDIHMRMDLEEMDTLRETVGIALSDRFQHKGSII